MASDDNVCQLCGMSELSFEPETMYCSCCGSRIKRNKSYYCTPEKDSAQLSFCSKCYNNARGVLYASGKRISKAKLCKEKNDQGDDEPVS